MLDVIIPARNEEKTIAGVIKPFLECGFVSSIIVAVDPETTDGTKQAIPTERQVTAVYPENPGKGQAVNHAFPLTMTENVLLCDADYTGLKAAHITRMAQSACGLEMVLGVPDCPPPAAFRDAGHPVPLAACMSWPWLTGLRIVPRALLAQNLHGYLVETQLNAAHSMNNGTVIIMHCRGLQSPLRFTEQRWAEMNRDFQYGKENMPGVLSWVFGKPVK